MVQVRNYKPTGEGLDEPAVALFQEQWQLYRKFVDNNYFYHREVYGQLHRILVDEVAWPFRLLVESKTKQTRSLLIRLQLAAAIWLLDEESNQRAKFIGRNKPALLVDFGPRCLRFLFFDIMNPTGSLPW
jgi:hypothetical protein